MSDTEWREDRSGDTRRWVAYGPGGYKARILVMGTDVSARLGRPQEQRDSYVVEAHGLLIEEIEPAIERLKLRMEERFALLEDGHS